MNRPRLSAIERREAILEAALPLFAERGFSAVTTRDIADAAGVSEALLYRHFRGKQAIFEALQSSCAAHATNPTKRLQAMPDSTASLVLCVYALMWKIQVGSDEDVSKHSQMQKLTMRSLLSNGEFASAFLRKTSEPWVAKMRSCIQAARQAGDIKTDQDDAELGGWLAHHISIAIRMYALGDQQIIDYPGDRKRLLERTVEFCLRGMGLTDEAIRAHYHPTQLAVLLET